eukprot:TRINITY_DN40984_c0_g1_i1.p1 TRINITY_DN40984_c0_g1~~TRINITY_DN40984_c0_g1_i1.p1  ORF type:complete len:359 (+),score=83.79 TRINITY_DN40984_c0_g1_i1:54-1079(+)
MAQSTATPPPRRSSDVTTPVDGRRRAEASPGWPMRPSSVLLSGAEQSDSESMATSDLEWPHRASRRPAVMTVQLRRVVFKRTDPLRRRQWQLSVTDAVKGSELLSTEPQDCRIVDRDPDEDTATFQLDLSPADAIRSTVLVSRSGRLSPPSAMLLELIEFDVIQQRFSVLHRAPFSVEDWCAQSRSAHLDLGNDARCTISLSFQERSATPSSTVSCPPTRGGARKRSSSEYSGYPESAVSDSVLVRRPLQSADDDSARGDHTLRMVALQQQLERQREYARDLEARNRLLAAKLAAPRRGSCSRRRRGHSDGAVLSPGAASSISDDTARRSYERVRCDCIVS